MAVATILKLLEIPATWIKYINVEAYKSFFRSYMTARNRIYHLSLSHRCLNLDGMSQAVGGRSGCYFYHFKALFGTLNVYKASFYRHI